MLVGRPNVGKSTLFNRITNSRRAIVTPIAGTTRDVNSLPAEWQGTPFRLVDTGGMFGASEDPLHDLVVQHGRRALEEADVLVFVVDGREGLVSGDEEIAAAASQRRRRSSSRSTRPTTARAGRALEFYQLGFDPVVEVAAEHGDGRRRPPRRNHRAVPAAATADPRSSRRRPRWRSSDGPNVGKSSLLNRLLREERSIVSEMPGHDERYRGCRCSSGTSGRSGSSIPPGSGGPAGGALGSGRGRVGDVARRAIEQADVAVLVIDSVEGATDQDAAIAGEADKAGCGIIIAANKWDLMKGRGRSSRRSSTTSCGSS